MNSGMRSMGETSHTTANQSQALFLRDTSGSLKQSLEEQERGSGSAWPVRVPAFCGRERGGAPSASTQTAATTTSDAKNTRTLGAYDQRETLAWTRAARLST